MTPDAETRPGYKRALIWAAFACALILATAPVWQQLVFGFNPSLDEILALAACRTR